MSFNRGVLALHNGNVTSIFYLLIALFSAISVRTMHSKPVSNYLSVIYYLSSISLTQICTKRILHQIVSSTCIVSRNDVHLCFFQFYFVSQYRLKRILANEIKVMAFHATILHCKAIMGRGQTRMNE